MDKKITISAKSIHNALNFEEAMIFNLLLNKIEQHEEKAVEFERTPFSSNSPLSALGKSLEAIANAEKKMGINPLFSQVFKLGEHDVEIKRYEFEEFPDEDQLSSIVRETMEKK